MSDLHLQRQLSDAAQELGLDLGAAEQTALLEYLAQMQRWNRTYNLTAIRDMDQMLVQHVIDSLAIVRPLQQALAKTDRATVVDVGSGAGLPGSVLAITCPKWTIHCVDAVEKKMAFVRQISGVLHLPNLHAVHGRVEEIESLNADIVVSRAFASLLDFATLAGKHVGANGRLAAMKGRYPEEEIDALHAQTKWQVESVLQLQVPKLNAHRCLIWISRQGIA